VQANQLTDYVERVVRNFLEDRKGDETFADWAARADEEVLR
jgi:sulfite reductase (ferredoxin)